MCLCAAYWTTKHTGRAALLAVLVPYVLGDRLPGLPPELMQWLVEHFAALGRPRVVERCVLHMALESIDFNQVGRG